MWVIGLITGGAVLAALLLIVPVDMTFFAERDAAFRMGGTVSILFGLIRKTWKSGKHHRWEEGRRTAKREGFTRRSGRFLRAVFDTRESVGKFLVRARDILQTVEMRGLYARVRIGLGDPGDTGMFFAALVPLTEFVRLSSADIRIEPDFEKATLEGQCRVGVRAVPIRFVRPLVPLLFSRTAWSLVQAAISARWTRMICSGGVKI